MFERYTERARRVIFFARYEASQYGSNSIETEHLLLGLVREDPHVIKRFVTSAPVDFKKKVEERMVRQPKISTSIDLPLTNEGKRILAYANEEAERLNHRHIGTEHLLLGILRESTCLAARLLDEIGMKLDDVRVLLSRSTPSAETPSEGSFPPMASFDRDGWPFLFDTDGERNHSC
jgi:ATP-dependent Clp protease ATP-binding subunit ClpC